MNPLPSTFVADGLTVPSGTAANSHHSESASSTWPHFMTGQPGQPVRVILVDDDPHMRRVISHELLDDLRIHLIGQGESFREGKRMIGLHEFDVLLVDLNLGDGTGFQLIEYMKNVRPAAEAIVVSAMEDEEKAMHAFALGATGYLIKNSWFGSFPQAVLQVVNGGASITPNLARRLLHRLDAPNLAHRGGASPAWRVGSGTDSSIDHMSEREREILRLVALGYTSGEIGKRLSISDQTVNSHIRNIYRKLRVHTRAQAVSQAAIRGLLY